ncbi:MAG: GGDEF domain-containing protein [Deltaproteobacteria bacterium]|nr:GGDEF domain-containing protein [Deltaproteobacteria bacterium]MBN2674043.1 GGDEF domain-containing protein [Deltaproteobacteria bacterium]
MSESSQRIKIGVIIDAIHEQYQSGIWKGITHRAKTLGIDLISFIGTSQDGVDHFDTHYDVIQPFAPNSDIDGVIIFSGSITEHHGKDFTRNLCKTFGNLPLVCVSEKISGFPCIIVENAPGIELTIDHMVSHHNLHNIAFIKGPNGHAEAEERFEAYKRSLIRNHLELDEELIFDGSFIARDGAKATRELIQKGIPFDGIVCVNDHTAFGVLEELSRQNLHVPGNVSVAGFDDVKEAAMLQPALSTVRQPLFRMGEEAVNNIVEQINGGRIPEETVLPTEPVYRRSCGCFSDEVENAKAIHTHISGLSPDEIVNNIFDTTYSLIATHSAAYPGDDKYREKLQDLVDSLVWDVKKPLIRHIFLNEVDILLFSTSKFADSVSLLQTLLRELTVYVTSLFDDAKSIASANNILQQGAALIREHRSVVEQRVLLDEKHFQLNINVTSQRVISSFEQRELLEAIAKGLPTLDVQSLVLATFQEGSINRNHWHYPDTCNLLLAYNQTLGKVIYPRGVTQISSHEIFPRELRNPDKPHNHIFMPLYYRDEYLGYMVLEFAKAAPLFMYEELRLHVSSAIKSALLLRKFKAQSMIDELTGVYNRRGFVTLGEKMLASAKGSNMELMMFYADVDGLKLINDKYGHEDGDIIISGAASVLCETFRERDLIARIGGDEFVILLVSKKMVDLEDKIRDRFALFEQKFNENLNKPYKLSVSLGAAICNMARNEPLDKLMKRADADLFGKKRARKLAL